MKSYRLFPILSVERLYGAKKQVVLWGKGYSKSYVRFLRAAAAVHLKHTVE